MFIQGEPYPPTNMFIRVNFNLLLWLSTGGGEHDTNEAETHKGGLRGYAVHMT
jgi:hypothetical protein